MPSPSRGASVLQVGTVVTVTAQACTITVAGETYTLPYLGTVTAGATAWVLFSGRTGLVLGGGACRTPLTGVTEGSTLTVPDGVQEGDGLYCIVTYASDGAFATWPSSTSGYHYVWWATGPGDDGYLSETIDDPFPHDGRATYTWDVPAGDCTIAWAFLPTPNLTTYPDGGEDDELAIVEGLDGDGSSVELLGDTISWPPDDLLFAPPGDDCVWRIRVYAHGTDAYTRVTCGIEVDAAGPLLEQAPAPDDAFWRFTDTPTLPHPDAAHLPASPSVAWYTHGWVAHGLPG